MHATFRLFILCFLLASAALHAQDTMHGVGKVNNRTSLVADWEKVPRDSNRAFVAAHSDRAESSPLIFHEGTFLPESAQTLKSAKVLNVVGPFRRNNAEFLLRLDSVGMACDSVQAAHILISYTGSASRATDIVRTRERARKRADSLCSLIQAGKATFESFVVPGITDDPGSLQGNQGNYGWFTRESPFVEVFKQGAFSHAVGETFVFESDFGFHIMQVKAKTKEYPSYFAWQIVKIVDSCFLEDGVTPNVWLGGYPGGREKLDRIISQRRLQYPSIAKADGTHRTVMVLFDIRPNGTVSDVRLEYADRLTSRQRLETQKLFLSLAGFTPQRTCNGPMNYTDTYFFEI